ncbi:MAG: hypothetical protein HQL32_07400 [Planctomycetes bacterium]|nr:hypothetical protein [Planctomycetota bacterium]
MVKTTILTLLCVFSLSLEALIASPLVIVQRENGHPRNAESISAGEQFECLTQITINTDYCQLSLSSGTIGVRLSPHEFFIAEGTLKVVKVKELPYGKRVPLTTIKFLRGSLTPLGEETLSIQADGHVRLYKKENSGMGSIVIDSRKIRLEANHLLVALNNHYYVLKKNEGAFSTNEIVSLKFPHLLKISRIIKDSKPAKSSRSQDLQAFVDSEAFHLERKLSQAQARRHSH